MAKFVLEALPAKHGDSLLLHYGTADDPKLIIIDGGPSGVYNKTLKKRLHAIRDAQDPDESLEVRLLMVSHIDDDHIKGVLDLSKALVEAQQDQRQPLVILDELWHNSFDDIVGNHSDSLLSEACSQISTASTSASFAGDDSISAHGAAMIASVPQGRQLRDDAKRLGWRVNKPAGDLGLLLATGHPADPIFDEDGLKFFLIGPSEKRLLKLQEEWDKELEKRGLAEDPHVSAAAYVDNSVSNLASIVVIAESNGKRMLLTGDARGDDILEGLEEGGFMDEYGRVHVEVLKMPHHGSDNNVETHFFRRVLADHYVFSGEGRHHNPELETFRMIFEAREPRATYCIHLTYRYEEMREDYEPDKLRQLLEEAQSKNPNLRVILPEAQGAFQTVDLTTA